MRYYIQTLTVFTVVSLAIICSYLYLIFTPQKGGVAIDTPTAIVTSCSEDLLIVEVSGLALVHNGYLKTFARENIQARADELCHDAQTVFADIPLHDTSLPPFRLTAVAEYHTFDPYHSVRIQFYTETGGAHGNTTYETKTVTTRSSSVSLTDLFISYDITEQDFIDAVITELTRNRAISFLTPLTELSQIAHWHITNRGLIAVTFPPYTLAPYSFGTLETTIDPVALQQYSSPSAANGT